MTGEYMSEGSFVVEGPGSRCSISSVPMTASQPILAFGLIPFRVLFSEPSRTTGICQRHLNGLESHVVSSISRLFHSSVLCKVNLLYLSTKNLD